MSRNARRRRMERRAQALAARAPSSRALPARPVQPGVCRYCKCTELNACRTPPSGEPCCWADERRTVCSNPSCLAQWRIDRERDRREREDAARRREYWRMTRELTR